MNNNPHHHRPPPHLPTTDTPNPSPATPSNGSRWFEEECGIDHDDTPDDYEENETDLYNEYLASELLEEDYMPPDRNASHDNTPLVSTVVDNTEGLGTIFPRIEPS